MRLLLVDGLDGVEAGGEPRGEEARGEAEDEDGAALLELAPPPPEQGLEPEIVTSE